MLIFHAQISVLNVFVTLNPNQMAQYASKPIQKHILKEVEQFCILQQPSSAVLELSRQAG